MKCQDLFSIKKNRVSSAANFAWHFKSKNLNKSICLMVMCPKYLAEYCFGAI